MPSYYDLITGSVTTIVFSVYYYRHMADIYSVPYKVTTSLRDKIVDFIMASLYSGTLALGSSLVAYLASAPIALLIDIINSENKDEMNRKINEGLKPFQNINGPDLARKIEKGKADSIAERKFILRGINHDIEMRNRKGYPYQQKVYY